MENVCRECRFFDLMSALDPEGWCRINPPVRFRVEGADPAWGRWPMVTPTDWCGKFERRSD